MKLVTLFSATVIAHLSINSALAQVATPPETHYVIVRDLVRAARIPTVAITPSRSYCDAQSVLTAPDGLLSVFIYPLKLSFEHPAEPGDFIASLFPSDNPILRQTPIDSSLKCAGTSTGQHAVRIFSNTKSGERKFYKSSDLYGAAEGVFKETTGYRLTQGDELYAAIYQGTPADVNKSFGGKVTITFRAFFYCATASCVTAVNRMKPSS